MCKTQKNVFEPFPNTKNWLIGPKKTKKKQQAEVELGQAQPKLRLRLKLEDFN